MGSIPTSRPNCAHAPQLWVVGLCELSVSPESSQNEIHADAAVMLKAGLHSIRAAPRANERAPADHRRQFSATAAHFPALPCPKRWKLTRPTAAACCAIAIGSRRPCARTPDGDPGAWARGFVGFAVHQGHRRESVGRRVQRRSHEHAQLRRHRCTDADALSLRLVGRCGRSDAPLCRAITDLSVWRSSAIRWAATWCSNWPASGEQRRRLRGCNGLPGHRSCRRFRCFARAGQSAVRVAFSARADAALPSQGGAVSRTSTQRAASVRFAHCGSLTTRLWPAIAAFAMPTITTTARPARALWTALPFLL